MNRFSAVLVCALLLALTLPLRSLAGTETYGIRGLPALGSGSTGPTAINEKGEVVGSAPTGAPLGVQHAVLWLPWPAYGLEAGLHDLGTLGTPALRSSRAGDINDLGQIVGFSELDLSGPFGVQTRAFAWQDGVMSALPQTASGAPYSQALGINDLGEVVGSEGFGLTCTPLLWLPSPAYGYPAGVSTLPPLGERLEGSGYDINNRGQIVGTGVFDGQLRAFLLEPILFADGFESQDTSAWSQTVP